MAKFPSYFYGTTLTLLDNNGERLRFRRESGSTIGQPKMMKNQRHLHLRLVAFNADFRIYSNCTSAVPLKSNEHLLSTICIIIIS